MVVPAPGIQEFALSACFNPPVKSHMIFDLVGGLFGFRVVPGCIGFHLLIDPHLL
jgi:hypothetical protein